MQAKLLVVGGEIKARQFELDLPAVIGRSRNTDVTLGHPLVSRRHCEVFESQGLLMVRDLGSLNGTFVAGSRLAEEPTRIEPGGQFTVGPITFQAEYQSAKPHSDSQTLDAPIEASKEEPGGTPDRS